MKKWLIVLWLALASFSVLANEASPLAQDPEIEARLKDMSHELRCLVCQNQTLADSDALLAQDLRREIRLQMQEGKSNQEVMDYLVSRYGDFVRYRPPLKSSTVLLWLGPFVLLLAGGVGLFIQLRRRQKMTTEVPLSAEEARKISELLDKES
ncbi:MAG: cytochrome c-type biogenesis protein CcmH [Methylotenera sp.]|uniref:cytochrome c-type biogenesis protein n=1 Tax=Methylotenera sp. TaxID=2051956 RepID=UPI0027288223|nr:cytochrome c-type biogenesis protein [Methylotenera sp.]MDO9142496.1 cytochrome c-type biogenesis protein CcmH [Methylobacter sp.]MDO9392794.1 cytochrome c-type biogenesis protein CcmH [Methylotenera sp.]